MNLTTRTLNATLTLRDAADGDGRTIAGVAVPLDTPTEIIPGYVEKIARGAVDLNTRPMLFYRHREPIGVITEMRETDAGLEIVGRISDTSLGRDAATLAKDQAIQSLSIGFYEVEYVDEVADDDTITRTQTRIDLREVSLVPIPAYDDAKIHSIRSKPTHETPKETPMTDSTLKDRAGLDETLSLLERRLALLETTPTHAPAPAETRSAGELLVALTQGDESARQAIAPFIGRAPATTTAVDGRYEEPTFIKDLTRLISVVNPLMGLFSTGSLPAEGNTLEFARLKSNTMKVSKQANEGDTLPIGKVEVTTANATISTYGGASTMSRQAIERTRTNVLDLHMRALALAAGKQLATEFAAFFETTVKGQESQAITTTKAADALDWKSLLHLLLDAQFAYEDQGLTCDGLILDRNTFEAIAGMTAADGRPILTIAGTAGTNAIGTVSASGRYANLDGLKVITNRFLTPSGMGEGVVGSFYNTDALRTYSSGTVSLQDSSALDLTSAFSIYFYAAFADEIPAGLVPMKIGA